MAQIKPVWEEIPKFIKMANQLVEKYPERFGNIETEWLVAYGITNKDKPERNTKPYEMSGIAEPESFACQPRKYFVKFYMSDWEGRSEVNQMWVVFSALSRLDRDEPGNGKVAGFDYKDQATLIRTLGPDWYGRGDLPNLLSDNVDIVDEVLASSDMSSSSSVTSVEAGFEAAIESEVNA